MIINELDLLKSDQFDNPSYFMQGKEEKEKESNFLTFLGEFKLVLLC